LVGDEEVVLRAAKLRRVARRRLVTVGSTADAAGLESGQIGVWQDSQPLTDHCRPGEPNRAAGTAQLAWIDQATELVSTGICQALVTAAVSKAVIAGSGAKGARRFRGHTEHLARRLAAEEVVMAFSAPSLTTALVTTHLAHRRVARAITPAAVSTAAFHLVKFLAALGHKRPRVVVASLNPHAGEGGLLARRRLARSRQVAELTGPLGAETAYRCAVAGQFDGVLAMYHDQATIPCKLLGFGEAVNVTLGLPIVRTSVDHGTAYDVAGSGRASARGMLEALELAARLAPQASKR
jgi:4-hydroxythreonine-4-phosphate dehydrogenase